MKSSAVNGQIACMLATHVMGWHEWDPSGGDLTCECGKDHFAMWDGPEAPNVSVYSKDDDTGNPTFYFDWTTGNGMLTVMEKVVAWVEKRPHAGREFQGAHYKMSAHHARFPPGHATCWWVRAATDYPGPYWATPGPLKTRGVRIICHSTPQMAVALGALYACLGETPEMMEVLNATK